MTRKWFGMRLLAGRIFVDLDLVYLVRDRIDRHKVAKQSTGRRSEAHEKVGECQYRSLDASSCLVRLKLRATVVVVVVVFLFYLNVIRVADVQIV
jgi:hypothetical protein